MSNVVAFKGIGVYMEELAIFAASLQAKLSVYSSPQGDEWWANIESLDSVMIHAEAGTMNGAVMDLYRMVREFRAGPPDVA